MNAAAVTGLSGLLKKRILPLVGVLALLVTGALELKNIVEGLLRWWRGP